MDKRCKKEKMKNQQVSIYSGKTLHGHKCIREDEAINYLRSLGHIVSNKPILGEM
jgi:hypothetical protein